MVAISKSGRNRLSFSSTRVVSRFSAFTQRGQSNQTHLGYTKAWVTAIGDLCWQETPEQRMPMACFDNTAATCWTSTNHVERYFRRSGAKIDCRRCKITCAMNLIYTFTQKTEQKLHPALWWTSKRPWSCLLSRPWWFYFQHYTSLTLTVFIILEQYTFSRCAKLWGERLKEESFLLGDTVS